MKLRKVEKPIKYCRVCDYELILDSNWTKSNQMNSQYICNNCNRKRSKEWRKDNSEKVKEYFKIWTNENPDYMKVWKNTNHNRYNKSQQHWTDTNQEKVKYSNKKYKQTVKGRVSRNKAQAKRNRNLGWVQMYPNPFADSVEIEWHHINNKYVVAIPKDIHQLYYGYKEHRELCMEIVKQIYVILK